MRRIGVFARNHEQYLARAAELSAQDLSRLITFRSSRRWASAKTALDKQKIVQVYFSPNGADGRVMYEGTLKRLVLNPKKGDHETEAALCDQLPETAHDSLWESEGKPVKTLYSVSHITRLAFPFSMTELLKESDSSPISPDYGYSYVPVIEREAPDTALVLPDEIDATNEYFEGTVRKMFVNAFERNPKARQACLDHYGYSCLVCGFNFEAAYGEIGAEFIHVHHIKPLASIGIDYIVDPICDLRPVCPNCHAMIHKKNPPFKVEELSCLIQYAKG